ncbi:MAG: carbamoyltransferase HypF [Myxococcota bacterium]
MEREVGREILVRGIVQGVGFRPWAARRAADLDLAGEIRNASWGVRVVLEGRSASIAKWLESLGTHGPEGARVDSVEVRESAPTGRRGFAIEKSRVSPQGNPTRIPPDRPLCRDCLDDLFDPADRRHRYAFGHCASCGPRASVIRGLPYDRERTTLAPFAPCEACEREYRDPGDRRHHAESIACPGCGPTLEVRGPRGEGASAGRAPDDAVEAAADCLRAGGIVAVKGYGGFHLLCDATRGEVVSRLRKRKARPVKPFAVMLPDLERARAQVELTAAAEAWLAGPARAVVVAPRRETNAAASAIAREVAPRSADLGVVLPFAPVHWLLLYAPGAHPRRDPARFEALVFTSANLGEEPTVHDDTGVRERLAGLADLVVTHDRAVARPSDDPVVRAAPGTPIPIRLSRGAAPLVLPGPRALRSAPVVLAVGGDLKAAPALWARGEAVLAEHVGDLANVESAEALEERARALCEVLEARPDFVAHDLHPDYVGTAIARRLAADLGARTIAVQHHHAHAASCLLENACEEPALALVLDGAGWGPDGSVWGGELLRVDRVRAERLAHLDRVPLPGGDAAVREPWRVAWSWLRRAFPDGDAPRLPWHERRAGTELALLARAVERGVASPWTSSCGRLFDAVASLLDLGDRASHEGELAMALEDLAESAPSPSGSAVRVAGGGLEMGVGELVRDLVEARARGVCDAVLARDFHRGLAARLAGAVEAASRSTGLRRVALSGGCLQNRLLRSELVGRLEARGLEVLIHRRTPTNDGGLAVGQAAVAAARAAATGC